MNRRQYVEYTRFQPESSMQRKLGSESLFLTKSEKNADLNKVIAKNQIIGTRQCQPKRKFGFMKTHKTGSSNVQHRLLVYAYRNDVNVILPQTGNYVNNPKHKYVLDEPFRLEWLNGVSWHRDFVKNNEYGIQALHTKWNYTAYRTLLGPSAVFSTIVRNPVHTFESQYSYYGFESHYGMNISEYLKRLERNPTTRFKRDSNKRGLNQQSWDLGMMGPDLEDPSVIEAKIQSMDQEFDLVMINEFMDESLVLLANLLCLPLSTMSGLKMNQRKSNAKVKLTQDEVATLKRFQLSDERIYAHFFQKFLTMWDKFGKRQMKESVQKLQQWDREVERRCVSNLADKASLQGTIFAPYNGDVIAYKIRDDDNRCKMMAITELNLISLIQSKQRRRWLKLL